jgi:tetratricopeptide (TPR) repeat protein
MKNQGLFKKSNRWKVLGISLSLFFGILDLNGAHALSRGAKKTRVFKTGLAARETNPYETSRDSALRGQLAGALKAAQAGQFQNAAAQLFNLGRRSELEIERPQIKYILGLMLMEMKLNQTAAFQFVDVIRLKHPKYSKLAIEKLSIVADNLGDDTLLNYAVSRVDIKDVPGSITDMIYFRLGEIKQKNQNFEDSIRSYNQVTPGSSYYNQALFNKGLNYLELGQTNPAIQIFQGLIGLRSQAGVTDTNKVAAQLGLARALYQGKKWDEAVEAYSDIPRDHFLWHDALFEQSWAMLRSARFRSALSNFQSIHSSYYEDSYIPESLLLRSIIYLYICKYDEMEKVLSLFDRTYGPVRARISDFMRTHTDSYSYYLEVEKAQAYFKDIEKVNNLKIPLMVAKGVLDQGDVRRSLTYLRRLGDERSRIEESAFRGTPLGLFGIKILANRAKNTKLAIGDMVKAHFQDMRVELKDLYEQAGLFDMK